MAETVILTTREARRSYPPGRLLLAVLLLGLPFLGRQRISVSDERIVVEEGFLTKTRDDVEVFRIRDVVSSRTLWQRLLGVGDIVIRATAGPGQPEEVQKLRGIPDPVGVSEAIRTAWNRAGRPRTATAVD